MFLNAVRDFNKKRNGFELDYELEMNMLKEEIREFFDAEDLAEMVDAYVDVDYVFSGTKIKYSYNFTMFPEEFTIINDEFESIAYEIMLEKVGSKNTLNDIINKAKEIVANANAMKGTKLDENGKVFKDEEYKKAIDATQQIREMLKSIGL